MAMELEAAELESVGWCWAMKLHLQDPHLAPGSWERSDALGKLHNLGKGRRFGLVAPSRPKCKSVLVSKLLLWPNS